MRRRQPRSTRTDTLFPYTTLCRSTLDQIFRQTDAEAAPAIGTVKNEDVERHGRLPSGVEGSVAPAIDGVQRLAARRAPAKAVSSSDGGTGLLPSQEHAVFQGNYLNFAMFSPSCLARAFTDSSLRASALAIAFSAMPFFASVWSFCNSSAVQGCLCRSKRSPPLPANPRTDHPRGGDPPPPCRSTRAGPGARMEEHQVRKGVG